MAGGLVGKLKNLQVRTFANKAEAGKKLGDGNGLFLLKTPAGSALWRVKYRIHGKEKLYSLGSYPAGPPTKEKCHPCGLGVWLSC